MSGAVQLNIINFSLIYLLLVVVLIIMKKLKINQMKLLILASVRMTVQLILVGFILQFILKNANPIYTVIFLVAMLAFSVQRALSGHKAINLKFKVIIGLSLSISGLMVLVFFVVAVVRENIFNAQYTIPLAGMIIGNAMTGISLGIKTFRESLKSNSRQIQILINLGASPDSILRPLVSQALETAILPTLNSMLGMGIIFLPGMMTGQILSGTSPNVAILYQIAIMIAICTSVCLSVFLSLHLGHKTLYNKRNQINLI